MTFNRILRRQLQQMVGPAIGALLSLYFGYHLIQGERGISGWLRLNQAISDAQVAAAAASAERQAYERRVQNLQADHIDRDLLDERARKALNLIGPNEVQIPLEGTSP